MPNAPSADLLARYRQNDAEAAEEIYRRYTFRLMRLVRSRMSSALGARLDPEDVVLSAWRSFFVLARSEEVVLREVGDLWRLLARITVRKVCRAVRRQQAACRSVARESPWADEEEAALAQGPSPLDAALLADELRALLAPLPPLSRQMFELRLLGHEVDEIAGLVGRSPRTVRRVFAWLQGELQTRLTTGSVPSAGPNAVLYEEIVLQKQLGQGGMGKVYRARWRNQSVAVKLLPRPLRGHSSLTARFLQEAALLGRLHHPGIIRMHGLGLLPDGGHFLVMELAEGGDLSRLLANGPVSVNDALRWTMETAESIEFAHQQGVIHCDLKPSNLLLDTTDRVRVTDFGLARARAEGGSAGGTPGFMAPEQRHADGSISVRTDVHGLGGVLFALLTAKAPYASDGTPQHGSADAPAPLLALCRQCLAERPEDRPDSAAEVRASLELLSPFYPTSRPMGRHEV